MLDRDLYRGRAGENVEYCDQLSAHKKLICVKRMDGSDKMSHLFQQGSVSAQLIMTNDEYKAGLMEKLRLLDANAEFGSPLNWTVVYAIATSKPGLLKDVLPFFSRAALRMHAQAIKGTGIKVAVAKIERKKPESSTPAGE